MKRLVAIDQIASLVHVVRGHRVLLDADLAALYQVSTKRLNEQVSRNPGRFPADFAFQLTPPEVEILRSQFATSSAGWGGRRYRPRVFTEHGALMLSSVLKSRVAIETSIHVVRVFVQLRGLVAGHAELSRKLDALEARYDQQFKVVFDAIRELMTPPAPPPKRIGFRAGK
jgi:hypothetical protein